MTKGGLVLATRMGTGAGVSVRYFPSELPWLQRNLPWPGCPTVAGMHVVIDLLVILLIISNLTLAGGH